MRPRRLLALAPFLILALVLAPAAQAGNTVWVGLTGARAVQESFSGKCFGVSPRLAHTRETVGQIGPSENIFEIRDDGTMKAWTVLGYTQAKANNPLEDPPDASVRFDLLRPYGTPHPTKIAESQAAAHLDGITSNPFTQAVEAGDGFGVDLESNPGNEESEAWIGCTAGGSGENNAIWFPPLVSNNGPAGEPEQSLEPAYLLQLGAEVEYDAPVITGISQTEGPLNGENKVTITGEHLKYSHVEFGENDAGKYEETDSTAVIRVPAGRAEGPIDVVLETAGGTSTLTDGYTYGPKEVHVETPEEKKAREEEEEREREEECEELEEEGKSCSSGGSGGGGGGGSGGETKPPAETPAKPNPGPSPAPAPSSGSSSTPTKFKLPQVKVAKAGGALSLAPSAPSPGVFHAQGIVVVPNANSHASHTRSIVYGSATAHAKNAGPVSLKLTPTAAAKSLLAKGKPLKVHLTVTFAPTSGPKTTKTEIVTVHG
jgi:IPT/TIG domain